jgi:hypothetical protein
MRGLVLASLVLGALGAGSGSPRAQDAPNLVGTWKGMPQSVHIGINPYRSPDSTAPVFSSATMEFTLTITEQKDNRFSGKKSGGQRSETVIGAISPNNQGGVMLDDDGQFLFTIRDANTLDVCYNHLNPSSKVVACYALRRSR